jgi:hypothetical protein
MEAWLTMTRLAAPFELLRDFLSSRMRMSHGYQPLMLKTLIRNGGWASLRDIASAFPAQDDSQIECCESSLATHNAPV